ncbi:MAG: DUF493 domain-containing protein [Methylococcales symbiont of Iophon sp. n. MRB-2018]|nr:MAG: DUF493 domain-containing protein [Methylococcales symbiont of Iophon sp. n. MRB-2018]KAF3980404.1 MAG: DUF493 domain-containing protein [Methylococcales symbiont of Iophon sp. n. MRB-2018]
MSEEDTLFEFPCQFPIKAMGKNRADFDLIVLAIIRQHVDDISDAQVKTRLSKGAKFASVTVTIEASSKKQLDAIYQGLTDCPEVVMTL